MTRLPALLTATALAFASTALWTPTATAAACSGTTGVTVVVDFASLGGGVQVGCAPGDPTSGLKALAAAGYGYTFASRQPGMVCRINGKPSSDPCVNAPPTTAYWSYWHATRGGSWTYSTAGAGSRNPAPGTVEGWAFGAGAPPAIAPPPPAATPQPPAPKPPTAANPTTTPRPAPTANPTTPPATTQSKPAGTTKPGVSTTSTRPTTTGTTTATAEEATTTPLPPVSADVDTAAGEQGSGGGTTSFVIGAGAVLLLAGLAIGAARRRTRTDEG